jgi:hypothetical protein
MDFNTKVLDELDEECRKYGLPLLSWIVRDIPGRSPSTPDQQAQVFSAAIEGRYGLLALKLEKWAN